jgi:anti-sigma B factor antagonist
MDADEVAFSVDVDALADGVRITPRGELDVATEGELRGVLERYAAEPVTLDLGALRFLDTSGLRLILETAEARRRDARPFAVLPGGPAVQRLFDLAGVIGLVPFRERGD